jgi:sugar/nucleoside kinase (ribokinase family)
MVHHLDLPTSLSIVLINSKGERSFIYNIGANAALSQEYLNWELITQSRILHIAGAGLYPELSSENLSLVLRKAKRCGVLTSVDTALNPKENKWESFALSLPYIDYFLPSLVEATALTSTDNPELAAELFLKEGVGTVVIKMGEKGSYVATKEERWQVSAFKVDVVDTCGAGDTSVAGFLTGILKGFKPHRAAQLANAVGALCITTMGATEGVRSYEDTLQFIEKNSNKTPEPIRIEQT